MNQATTYPLVDLALILSGMMILLLFGLGLGLLRRTNTKLEQLHTNKMKRLLAGRSAHYTFPASDVPINEKWHINGIHLFANERFRDRTFSLLNSTSRFYPHHTIGWEFANKYYSFKILTSRLRAVASSTGVPSFDFTDAFALFNDIMRKYT